MPEIEPDPNPLSRIELLQLAQGLGVVDADVMTRAELRAAIDKAQQPEPPASEHQAVTWVSVARRLLASVVERGLNLPDAAALIRGDTKLTTPPKAPPPVATVTLARIYAAQGHVDRAIGTLDEVLESDPDHELARDLSVQLERRRAELLARARAGAAPRAATDEVDAAPTEPVAAASVVPEAMPAPTEPIAAASVAPEVEPATTEAVPAASVAPEATPAPIPPSDPTANGVALPSSPRPTAAISPPEPPTPLPRVPGLLLIETDTPVRYVYWELSATGLGSPHWIHVVTHTPTGHGDTERRERAFPVHRELGALRLEGVPRQAVVRAKLTHRPNDAQPLVVAGSVRPHARGGGEAFEVRYAPYAKAKPEALASRAEALLDRASPVYWDA